MTINKSAPTVLVDTPQSSPRECLPIGSDIQALEDKEPRRRENTEYVMAAVLRHVLRATAPQLEGIAFSINQIMAGASDEEIIETLLRKRSQVGLKGPQI